MPAQTLPTICNQVTTAKTVAVLTGHWRKNSEHTEYRRLSITEELGGEFLQTVRQACGEITALAESHDLVLNEYDTGHKQDSHEIQWVKLDQVREILEEFKLVPLPVNATIFDGSAEMIDSLHHYIIVVQSQGGEPILFFRKFSPKQELGRSKGFAALFSNGQFDKIRETTFLFDARIDCIARGNFLYVLNQHNFQMIFRYFERLRATALESLSSIRAYVPIANFKAFEDSCVTHLVKLAKLRNIAQRDYLRYVKMRDLKKVIKAFHLPIEVIKEDGEERLSFDKAQPWLILNLLDDAYLGSVMTRLQYEVNSKRRLQS
ncbi:MAG TPA: Kiwa anti-phage protein KwaB-like domain-containing protein [Planctomycetota bacterium]|jgi:hypothetical protein